MTKIIRLAYLALLSLSLNNTFLYAQQPASSSSNNPPAPSFKTGVPSQAYNIPLDSKTPSEIEEEIQKLEKQQVEQIRKQEKKQLFSP